MDQISTNYNVNEQTNSTSIKKVADQRRVKCIVPACISKSANSPGLKFFRLPNHHSKRDKWLTLIGLKSKKLNNKNNFLCEKHFLQEHIAFNRLTMNAVPCLNITKIHDDSNVATAQSSFPTSIQNKLVSVPVDAQSENLDSTAQSSFPTSIQNELVSVNVDA